MYFYKHFFLKTFELKKEIREEKKKSNSISTELLKKNV